MRVARIVVAILFVASAAYAQNPLSRLKALQDDGIAEPVLNRLNDCLPLAPSPVGSFVPPDFPLTILPAPVFIPVLGGGITIGAFDVMIPGEAFLPPAPRLCPTISTLGISHGSPGHPPGHSTFVFELNADYSTFRTNGSGGGGCSLASGKLTFTKDSKGNNEQLVMTHAGLVCDTAGPLGPKVYTATYNITGGTRKYVGAAGTGSFSVSFNPTETLVHLDGNVLFR
jgi:hypothetical protein